MLSALCPSFPQRWVSTVAVLSLALFCCAEAHLPVIDRLVLSPEPVGPQSLPVGSGYTAKSAPGSRREPAQVSSIDFDSVSGPYLLSGRNAEGEGVECPKTIDIGKVGKPAAGMKLQFGAKSGVVRHADIAVDGVQCSSGGFLEVADLSELGSVDGGGDGKGVLARVAIAGDSEDRVCGKGKFRGMFQFYDDMPRYAASLEDIGGVPKGGLPDARAGQIFFPLVQAPAEGDSMDTPAAYCWYKNSLKQTDASGRPEVGAEEEGGSCFPSDATVELEDGRIAHMKDVRVGDSVKVGPQEFSRVFMFTHKLANTESNFIVLETESGARLALSAGHYIYADGSLVAASEVSIGSVLTLGNGVSDIVVSVSSRTGSGLYNPQTVHGDIVVNGVLSSTYTTAVAPSLAHIFLSPVRNLFAWTGVWLGALHGGCNPLVGLIPVGKYIV